MQNLCFSVRRYGCSHALPGSYMGGCTYRFLYHRKDVDSTSALCSHRRHLQGSQCRLGLMGTTEVPPLLRYLSL